MIRVLFHLLALLIVVPSWGQLILIPYQEDTKWGFKSYHTQEVLISPKYDYVDVFIGERAIFKTGNKYGYLDMEGNEVVKAQYKKISDLNSKNSANPTLRTCRVYTSISYGEIIKENGKVGYAVCCPLGNTILSPKYDRIIPFANPTQLTLYKFIAQLNNKWGIVKENDTILVPLEYDSIYFNEYENPYLLKIEKNGLFGFYSFPTNTLFLPEYISLQVYFRYVKVEISPGKFAYIDDQGRQYWK